jgi:glycosyltransferase involved in cell wall biosynthesis
VKSILYVQYTDPSAYPPLEHSSLLLADQGWSVRHLGITANGAAKAIVLPPHPSISISLGPAHSPGWSGIGHYARFLAVCRSEIRRVRPDVVYCSDLRSYPVGLWASTRSGSVTVLHEHDPPGSGDRLWRILHAARQRFARRASLVIVPQNERARDFLVATGADPARMHVVFNCPSQLELTKLQLPPRMPTSGLTLWFHGTIGSELVPMTLVEALARLPEDVRFEMAGYETVGSSGYVALMMERARTLGVADRIMFHGAVPRRSDLLQMAARADVGLALFANRFRDPMVGASNKPFDYLACGLPLLTNQTPEWEEFFGARSVSIGCNPEDTADIVRAILTLRNNPDRRRAMAERGQELVRTQWNYEMQFAPVLRALEATLLQIGPREPPHSPL